MRLTEIIKVNGKEYVKIKGTKGMYANAERKGAPASNAIVRLSAYEVAEAESRLVILPCKIGDTVYEIDLPEYGVIACKVLCFTYGRSNITGDLTWSVTVEVIEGHGLGSCYTFDPDDFDKTVFFTKQAAEAVLKRKTEET